MLTDVISDSITRIRNALSVSKEQVKVTYSKQMIQVLKTLEEEGYIQGSSVVEVRKGVKEINVTLKYYNGEPVIQEIKRVSKPSRRVYVGTHDIPLVRNGLGCTILSTSKGILSNNQAKELNVGGEVICSVF